jgi:hypothetical protein
MRLLQNKKLLFVLVPLMAIYALGLWFVLRHNDTTEKIVPAEPIQGARFNARIFVSMHTEDEITFNVQEITLFRDTRYKPDSKYCIDTVFVYFFEDFAFDYKNTRNNALSNYGKFGEPVCFVISGATIRVDRKFTFALHRDIYGTVNLMTPGTCGIIGG